MVIIINVGVAEFLRILFFRMSYVFVAKLVNNKSEDPFTSLFQVNLPPPRPLYSLLNLLLPTFSYFFLKIFSLALFYFILFALNKFIGSNLDYTDFIPVPG